MFNNYNLTDEEVLEIIEKYENLINKYSRLYTNGPIEEDLKQEIIIKIYMVLTKNREKIINLSLLPFFVSVLINEGGRKMVKELKLYLKQKKRRFIVRNRVISFKKKILKLKKEKDEMKRKSSLNLPIS